ncbi:unnamed protein product [Lampetra fluviatilis]
MTPLLCHCGQAVPRSPGLFASTGIPVFRLPAEVATSPWVHSAFQAATQVPTSCRLGLFGPVGPGQAVMFWSNWLVHPLPAAVEKAGARSAREMTEKECERAGECSVTAHTRQWWSRHLRHPHSATFRETFSHQLTRQEVKV